MRIQCLQALSEGPHYEGEKKRSLAWGGGGHREVEVDLGGNRGGAEVNMIKLHCIKDFFLKEQKDNKRVC